MAMASRSEQSAPFEALLHSVQHLLADETLLDQQRVFVQHVQNIAHPMQAPFGAVTTSAYPWLRIPLRDACATPMQTIVGYAKLLLERPDQFGAATISATQQAHFRQIHEAAVETYRWLHALDGFAYHREWRAAAAQVFPLDSVLAPLLIVLRYHLRDRITLQQTTHGADHRMNAAPYHTAQVIQHLIFSIVRELDAVRDIRVDLRQSPQAIILQMSLDAGTFDDEVLALLFERQGSRHYREQLARQHAAIIPGGDTLRLQWPRVG